MFLIKKIIYTTLIFLLMVFNINASDELSTGMDAPDFTLVDQDNIKRSLSDFKGEWVVLYFYPKDDTPGCTTEACSFRDNIEIINKLNIDFYSTLILIKIKGKLTIYIDVIKIM